MRAACALLIATVALTVLAGCGGSSERGGSSGCEAGCQNGGPVHARRSRPALQGNLPLGCGAGCQNAGGAAVVGKLGRGSLADALHALSLQSAPHHRRASARGGS